MYKNVSGRVILCIEAEKERSIATGIMIWLSASYERSGHVGSVIVYVVTDTSTKPSCITILILPFR
jgi:hypothetical protein